MRPSKRRLTPIYCHLYFPSSRCCPLPRDERSNQLVDGWASQQTDWRVGAPRYYRKKKGETGKCALTAMWRWLLAVVVALLVPFFPLFYKAICSPAALSGWVLDAAHNKSGGKGGATGRAGGRAGKPRRGIRAGLASRGGRNRRSKPKPKQESHLLLIPSATSTRTNTRHGSSKFPAQSS